jgi:hypothetical protein
VSGQLVRAGEHVGQPARLDIVGQSDTVPHRSLWIGVHEQGLAAAEGEGAREVDGGRRFADPSLLAHDGEDGPH